MGRKNDEVTRLEFIEAARGYAIMLVLAVHAVGYQAGAMGVQLFYIISAYTLYRSLMYRNEQHYLWFYIRRFFRIAPLYYLCIYIYIYVYPTEIQPRPEFWRNGGEVTLNLIISKLTFLSGWYPPYINSIVPGSWSISCEYAFYIILPMLFYYINTFKKAIVCFMVTLIFRLIANNVYPNIFQGFYLDDGSLLAYFLYFWLPNQLPVFIMGIIFFYVVAIDKKWCKNYNSECLMLTIVVFILLNEIYQDKFNVVDGLYMFLPVNVIFGLLMMLFLYLLSRCESEIFINKYIRFIGKVSFSIYLTHFMVLGVFGKYVVVASVVTKFILIVIMSIVVGSLGYEVVEKKGIVFGKYVIERLKLYV